MAKKQKVNKTQAVRDYLKAHPKAMSGEIAAALNIGHAEVHLAGRVRKHAVAEQLGQQRIGLGEAQVGQVGRLALGLRYRAPQQQQEEY